MKKLGLLIGFALISFNVFGSTYYCPVTAFCDASNGNVICSVKTIGISFEDVTGASNPSLAGPHPFARVIAGGTKGTSCAYSVWNAERQRTEYLWFNAPIKLLPARGVVNNKWDARPGPDGECSSNNTIECPMITSTPD